jgi:hypothetical protein
MMTRGERASWVARGYQDPVKAYRAHAVTAGQRGIEFTLSFTEWWGLWEPHYTERGKKVGQKVMCRTRDRGAYEVGNVRIDTVQGNVDERKHILRAANLDAGRLPTARGRQPLATQAPDDWLNRRTQVFRPYTEDEEIV